MHRVSRAALFAAVTCASVPARATSCVRPDLVFTVPADGARTVPRNATLVAKYDATAEYIADDESDTVTIQHENDDPTGIVPYYLTVDDTTGAVTRVDGLDSEGIATLHPGDLVPGDRYTVKWPGLRGIGTASRGRGATVSFTVAAQEDTAAPQFEGLTHVEWDVQREHDDCTDSVEERFRFDLTVGTATDDSDTRLLTTVVYQSHGGDADKRGEPVPVALAPYPGPFGKVTVIQSIDASEGHVCFAALVRDLSLVDDRTPRVSGGADREVCTHATPPPFFYGCTVGRPAGGKSRGGPPCALMIALSLWAMRRHRPAP
ncbi:MAG TPA: hypothetical protein VHE30_03345 [Polyangiaceae bacterium]|nr:hypothetical protein [Polyangiaceae bacterium]